MQNLYQISTAMVSLLLDTFDKDTAAEENFSKNSHLFMASEG